MEENAKIIKFPKKKKRTRAPKKAPVAVHPEPRISFKEIITIALGVIPADIVFELVRHLLHF